MVEGLALGIKELCVREAVRKLERKGRLEDMFVVVVVEGESPEVGQARV